MAEQNSFENIKGKNLSILKAILKSRKYSAYYILWIQALKVLFTPLDLFLSFLEQWRGKKKDAPEKPVIFIVGPHRSGTTFISQVISNAFPFHPIGNFNSLFHRSTYYPHRLFRKWIQKKGPPKYRNFYGIAPGLFTIGDTHEVWDRWYGGDHSIVPNSLDEEQKASIRRYLGTLEMAADAPLISKSGRNSMIMSELNKALPTAFFIIVKRDLTSIIRSTMEADETFFGKRTPGWGLRASRNFDPADHESFLEAICIQCDQVQRKVDEEKNKLPEDSYLEIDYQSFCEDPKKFLHQISKELLEQFQLQVEPDTSVISKFKPSAGRKKNQGAIQEIREELEKLGISIDQG